LGTELLGVNTPNRHARSSAAAGPTIIPALAVENQFTTRFGRDSRLASAGGVEDEASTEDED